MTSPRRHTTNAAHTRDRSREADIVTIPIPSPPVYERTPQVEVERIGDILRRTREKRGDDLHHIAEYLCIRRGYLEAIENSEYEKFPADAYVIGFLRSYAELLGLDGKEAINLYRAEMIGQRRKPALVMPTPMQEGRSPSAFILIGAIVTAILVYAVWYGLSTSDRATVSTPAPLPAASASDTATTAAAVTAVPVVPIATPAPPPPEPVAAAQSAPAAEPATPPKSAAQDPASVPAKASNLVIRAEQSSWVMILDSKGQTLFDRVLKPGETFKVPDGPGLTLTTGNGAGIVLTLDGVDLPKLSTSAAAGSSGILRNISLDSAHLRAMARRD